MTIIVIKPGLDKGKHNITEISCDKDIRLEIWKLVNYKEIQNQVSGAL